MHEPRKHGPDLGPAGDVDDRHSRTPHLLEQPAVGLRVPRLTCREEHAQRRHVRRGLAVRDQRPHQCWRAAEDRHALLLDQAPQPVGRPVGRPLREHEGRAHGAAADHGPGAHDPAHVGGEVDDVVGARVSLVAGLARDRDQEAALDVEHALGFPGRPGRIGEKVRMLGFDRERLERAGAAIDLVVPRRHDHVLERGRLPACLLEDLQHRHAPAASQRRPGGDRRLRPGVDQALRDRRRREAREDRHLDRSDVRAGVRGDRRLGRHRQVGRDAVPRPDTELDQPLREPRDRVRELGEGQLAPRPVLAAEDGRHPVAPPAVDAVPGDVQLGSVEPGRPLGAARQVDDLGPGLVQLDPGVLYGRRPEPLRILDRAGDELAVGREAVPAHQPDDVRVLEHVLGGRPDHLCHGRNPTSVSIH